MKTHILAALLATALALPASAQMTGDTTLRQMPLGERTVELTGPDYHGRVGRRDYSPDTIGAPPRGALFGQNPYSRGYIHSEDFGKVIVDIESWRQSERRWVHTSGGFYVELVDIGDQGSPVRIRLSALNKDGMRYTVRGGEVTIPGTPDGKWSRAYQDRWNRNLVTIRYEGFLVGARLEITTGPGAIPPADSDPGARGNGDGFLIAAAGRHDCLPEPQETNAMIVTRTRAR